MYVVAEPRGLRSPAKQKSPHISNDIGVNFVTFSTKMTAIHPHGHSQLHNSAPSEALLFVVHQITGCENKLW